MIVNNFGDLGRLNIGQIRDRLKQVIAPHRASAAPPRPAVPLRTQAAPPRTQAAPPLQARADSIWAVLAKTGALGPPIASVQINRAYIPPRGQANIIKESRSGALDKKIELLNGAVSRIQSPLELQAVETANLIKRWEATDDPAAHTLLEPQIAASKTKQNELYAASTQYQALLNEAGQAKAQAAALPDATSNAQVSQDAMAKNPAPPAVDPNSAPFAPNATAAAQDALRKPYDPTIVATQAAADDSTPATSQEIQLPTQTPAEIQSIDANGAMPQIVKGEVVLSPGTANTISKNLPAIIGAGAGGLIGGPVGAIVGLVGGLWLKSQGIGKAATPSP